MERRKRSRFLRKQKYIISYELSHFDKVIVGILVIVGSVMVFVGIKGILDKFDIFQDPIVLLLVGLFILLLTGSFIKISYKRE